MTFGSQAVSLPGAKVPGVPWNVFPFHGRFETALYSEMSLANLVNSNLGSGFTANASRLCTYIFTLHRPSELFTYLVHHWSH